MTSARDNWRLFGVDLFIAYEQWRAGWREALRWRWLAWLAPEDPVRLLEPDGNSFILRAGTRSPDRGGEAAQVDLWRVMLPDAIVLTRTLLLPHMSDAEMTETVRLEAEAATPFPVDNLVWGWRREAIPGERYRVDVVIAARNHVERHLETLQSRLRNAPAEVCALVDGRQVLFNGYGGDLRATRMRRRMRRLTLWLVLAVLLLVALNAVPVWHAKQRSEAVNAHLRTLQARVADTVAARDGLLRDRQRMVALTDFGTDRAGALHLMENLSRLLPDDVWLERLEIQVGQVRMAGRAANASALVQTLDQQPDYRNVRMPGAIAREAGGRERFVIEFEYGPERTP